MKKRIISLILILSIALGVGWSRLTKASGVEEFTARFYSNGDQIKIGEEVELKFSYKVNGQGNNIPNIEIEYKIPSDFEVQVSSLPSKWTINRDTLKGTNLDFNPQESIEFTIKLKAKSIGKVENFGIAKLIYNYNNGNSRKKEEKDQVVKLYSNINNSQLNSLIIDATSIKIEANIKNARTENNNSYIYQDEPLEVEYKLTPQGEINIDRKPVDIVLVVDTSGSMQMSKNDNHHIYKYKIEEYVYDIWMKEYVKNNIYYTDSEDEKNNYNNYMYYNFYYKSYDNPQYKQTKMYKTIRAAKYLTDNIYNNSLLNNIDDKVAIVDFDTRVNNPNDQLLSIKSTNNKNFLIQKIERMFGNGGTNIHEALLVAEKHLDSDNRDAEKHIIVLTDGMPTFYITDNEQKSYTTKYNDIITVYGNYAGPGSQPDDITKSITKNKVTDLKSKYKVHFVALNTQNGDIDINFFNEIKNIGSGISEIIDSTDKLQPLFNQIYQSITKSVVYSNITFQQNIPSQLQVEEVCVGANRIQNFEIKDGKLIVNLDNMVFENKQGIPSEVTINVKYKTLDTGIIDLGEAIISSKKLIEGLEYDYNNSCRVGSIDIRPRDFYNYVSFDNIKVNRNLIPENTYVTVNIALKNKQLFNMDSNARVELNVTPIIDNSTEVNRDTEPNKFIYNSLSENKSDKFKFKIIDNSIKEKDVSFKVTAIKVTYKGKEYNVTQDINKYFGEHNPTANVLVKKFTLR